KEDEEAEKTDVLKMGELTVLAVATSIDALAVGITFAFLKVNILPSVLLIGVTTFALSLGGVLLGNRFGAKYKSKAEIAGGIILILIGLKILLEHLGIINF
ncbi:MAG: manganese efflux pump MntP family protein, partial [Oscillospiraceae bacterium]|nr:manganese efflux pump MntP family protein [Oscillospiraceae bacterium]